MQALPPNTDALTTILLVGLVVFSFTLGACLILYFLAARAIKNSVRRHRRSRSISLSRYFTPYFYGLKVGPESLRVVFNRKFRLSTGGVTVWQSRLKP